MGTSASGAALARVRTLIAAAAAFILTLGLLPAFAFAAENEPAGAPVSVAATFDAERSGASPFRDAVAASEKSAEGATPTSVFSGAETTPMLASALMDSATSMISADVALDATEPLVGSFTIDGLTYAVNPDGLTLVSVAGAFTAPDVKGSAEGGFTDISIPETVTYNGTTYPVTSIVPYAFYLSGVTQVELPVTITSVDDRAFRSSDVERVEVAVGNLAYASFDGALYDASLSRLLLIPEGRKGSVSIPSEAEVVEPSVFSHCSLVDAISVDGDGAAYLSWDGLLYSADGTTLLRVPAGATEVTIKDGCTSIAAGALEGCANLERIHAPASVTSISPDVFTSVPTIALPAQSALRDGANSGVASALADQVNASTDFPEGTVSSEAETQMASQDDADSGVASGLSDQSNASTDSSEGAASTDVTPQLTAVVALSASDDGLPAVDPAAVAVLLPAGADVAPWRAAGFDAADAQGGTDAAEEPAADDGDEEVAPPVASLDSAEAYNGAYDITITNASGSTLYQTNANGTTSTEIPSNTIGCGDSSHKVSIAFREKTGAKGLILDMWHYAEGHSFYYWVKPGYVLTGVKVTGADGASETLSASTVGTTCAGTIKGKSRTISPIFEKITYKVALDGNGATTMGTSSVSVGYGSEMPTITIPKRAGYAFDGYSQFADGSGTRYYDGKGKSAHVWDQCVEFPTSLMTSVTFGKIYAQWRFANLSVDAAGGQVVQIVSAGGGWQNDYDNAKEVWTDTLSNTKACTVTGAGRIDYYNKDGGWIPIHLLRAGYMFTGWQDLSIPEGQTKEFEAGQDVTLTATWRLERLTIDGGGATILVNSEAQSGSTYSAGFWPESNRGVYGSGQVNFYDSNLRLCAVTLSRPGYVFAGWKELSLGADGLEQMTSGDLSLTATWRLATISIDGGGGIVSRYVQTSGGSWTLDRDNGKAQWNDTRYAGGSVTVYDYGRVEYYSDKQGWHALLAERSGYTFAGWSKSANGLIDPGLCKVHSPSDTGDLTLYAHWSTNPYTISYDLAGGSVSGNPTTYDVTTTTFMLKNPTRTGYTFTGWSGTGLTGTANKTVTIAKGSTGNRSYTANWSVNSYDVTFDANGGSMIGGPSWMASNPKITFDANAWIKVSAPKRTGYTFTGFYTAKSGGKKIYELRDDVAQAVNEGTYWKGNKWCYAGNTTFYAQWSANTYDVTFDANGGAIVGKPSWVANTPKVSFGSDDWSQVFAPSRAGCAFTGFYTARSGGTKIYEPKDGVAKMVNDGTYWNGGVWCHDGDATFYAQWSPVVAAAVPIEVTARVDLLGLADQEAVLDDEGYQGYIESRSGEALEVAEVSFEPMAGAGDLFGSRVADVSLQAFAEGSSAADYRFALDAAAVLKASDGTAQAASLSPFALPEGYGTRKHITYLFDIPEDLLASIDPARFSEVTTPVAQLVYTVALTA